MSKGRVAACVLLAVLLLPGLAVAQNSAAVRHHRRAARVAKTEATTPDSKVEPTRQAKAGPGANQAARPQRGMASYYGGGFQGRKTASGIPFDKNKLTAAHRTLPIGSKVRVTNLKSHKSTVVTVTDRGPHKPNRVIDVSKSAATELGFSCKGVAPVSVKVVKLPDGDGKAEAKQAARAPPAATAPAGSAKKRQP